MIVGCSAKSDSQDIDQKWAKKESHEDIVGLFIEEIQRRFNSSSRLSDLPETSC